MPPNYTQIYHDMLQIDEQTILKLLRYQRRHGFSISYMSKKYGISRTTLSKWNKIFEKQL
jgi:response regulator of citrate/malate metabolism